MAHTVEFFTLVFGVILVTFDDKFFFYGGEREEKLVEISQNKGDIIGLL